jgi:hypothetical protein
MSLNSIAQAAVDSDLQVRIQACANQEAHGNPDLQTTDFAKRIFGGYANYTSLFWGVAASVSAEYEAGLLSGRGAPGHDQDVVPDAAILSAVVANWPPNEVTTTTPPAP